MSDLLALCLFAAAICLGAAGLAYLGDLPAMQDWEGDDDDD